MEIDFENKKIKWTKKAGQESVDLGSTSITLSQNDGATWAPFIELYHGGDSIVWQGVF